MAIAHLQYSCEATKQIQERQKHQEHPRGPRIPRLGEAVRKSLSVVPVECPRENYYERWKNKKRLSGRDIKHTDQPTVVHDAGKHRPLPPRNVEIHIQIGDGREHEAARLEQAVGDPQRLAW